MSQSRKHRGYKTQRIVADYLRDQGWPNALPVGAGREGSDITGIDGLDIEIKARTRIDLPGTMRQLKERRETTGLGIAVLRCNGQGEKSVDEFVAVLTLGDLVHLLQASGY